MRPDRWERVCGLFAEALERAPDARGSFLEEACGDDRDLLAEVESLLQADAEASPLLDGDAEGLARILMASPASAVAGGAIGPYRLVREIGRGGMGAVYLAEREDVGKRVAIKVVRGALGAPENVERFLRERRVLARLEHPNIAALVDAGTTPDGSPFFAMEHVEGEPIDRYCDGRRLSVRERLSLFETVCAAVQYAHQRGIVHRDIKPSNILVAPPRDPAAAGEVKLLDFGIAKVLAEDLAGGEMTGTGARLMTPEFAAPEQIRGEAVDAAADVYALGVLLYRLLTGRSPYGARRRGAGEIERLVLTTHPPRPSAAITRRPSIAAGEPGAGAPTAEGVSALRATTPERLRRQLSGDLDAIVLRSLEKDPSARYPSAGELLADLRRSRAGLPVRARSTRLPYRAWKWALRNRRAAAAVPALVLAAVLALRWVPAPSHAAPNSPSTVLVLPFDVQGSAEYDYLREGMVSLVGARINAAEGLHSVDTRALVGFLQRPGANPADDGPEAAARHFQAGWYVAGRVVAGDGGVRISATLHRIGARRTRRVAQARVEGESDSLVVLVERLTEELLGAGGSARTPQLARTAALSTRSPAAMGLYLEGERHLRAGRHARALEAFRDAVLQDSSFALANLRLSIAATWAEPRLAGPASEEAVRWSRGLPPLDSMLILAWRQYQTGDPADAERLYRAVLAERPHDVEAWDQLAELLFHWGPTLGRAASGSREAFERVLHYEPANISALLHLARIAAHDGRTEALDTLAARIIRLEPAGRAAVEARALVAYTRESPEDRAAVLRDLAAAEDWELSALVRAVAASVPDPSETVGLLALMKSRFRRGTFQDAGDLLHAQVVAAGGQFATATEMLSAIEASETNWAREYEAVLATLPFTTVAERELRALRRQTTELASLPMIVAHHGLLTTNSTQIHPPNRLFLLGLLELRLGDAAAALAHARQLDALVPLGYTDAADLARVVRAAVQQARGQPRQALATLGSPRIPAERAFPVLLSYPGAVERWLRAELLNALGRDEEALRWYATFPDPAAHDLIWTAPAHFRQAQIHARRGETALANVHDRRFLALWRHADPTVEPWLRESRERIRVVPGARQGGAAERRPEP